jgi:GMP synthase (glutamine-hydrolysing)
MSHSDRISKLPPGFVATGHTSNSPVAAMENDKRKLYGVQFHPEVVHTTNGKKIIENFLFRIAGCQPKWTLATFIKHQIEDIRNKVGKEKVIAALSGGVDSSVLSVLLHKAIGNQLTTVFINNGLLRKNESKMVLENLKDYFDIKYVDAEEKFLIKLKGVVDPEEKRKIIGHEFIEIFEEEAKKVGKVKFLAQGTLYPDVIESRSSFGGPSATIKSHHNVGGLPEKMKMELIEPLKNLFKDEVRIIGKKLGLPEKIISRQPFPGPGLAVRIVGEVTKKRLNALREADSIVSQEIKKYRIYQKIWQSFAVLLPIKNVGVMGDERTYEEVIALRAISSTDGMTADWVKLPYSLLDTISRRIINEVRGINRVVYDISSKPPSTIEWE